MSTAATQNTPPQDPHLVLATDLDGTFLGGSEQDRLALYEWIEAHRDRVGLIFVTGRDLPFIEELCATTPAPLPDYVVGDVGTTIAAVDAATGRIAPEPALETEIAALWDDRGDWVRESLAEARGLTLQDGAFRYRMSYHYDPDSFDASVIAPIEAAGLDCLISANCFFDVLPRGISKGPSLLRLLDHIDAARDRVLVAGDTLNDLSLFETGLRGVAVGNSEQPLLEAIAGRQSVHFAEGHGCAGIAEAIAALGLPLPQPTRSPTPAAKASEQANNSDAA